MTGIIVKQVNGTELNKISDIERQKLVYCRLGEENK
jgi:hypothetical protein